jgi:tetratricopeptide (TPR) repeat protein
MKQKVASKPNSREGIKIEGINWMESPNSWKWIVFAISFLLYANSINFGYNLDDTLVTQNHRLTSKGISAIPKIFTSPYYQDDMGYSYEYRPMVLTSFAIEKSLFGENSKVSHFFNVLLYAILCLILFEVLMSLFVEYSMLVSLAITLLFVVHTIHTEVVCSIKNRDELLAMIFGLLSIKNSLSFVGGNKRSYIVFPLCFLAALMSKVTMISFVFIIPAILVLFRKADFLKYLGVVSILVFIGHFFITNIGSLNRHLFISFILFSFNIFLYILFNFVFIKQLAYKFFNYVKQKIEEVLVFFRMDLVAEEPNPVNGLIMPTWFEIKEGFGIPPFKLLLPAALFAIFISYAFYLEEGRIIFSLLCLSVLSLFVLPSGFALWIKIVISIYSYISLFYYPNISNYLPSLIQLLLFASFRIHQREKCSSLLLLFAFIFSVTDFYLHKELGLLFFFIVSTIGDKFKFHKVFGFVILAYLIYYLVSNFLINKSQILEYESLLPYFFILPLIFYKGNMNKIVCLFFVFIPAMLFISLFYYGPSKPVIQNFETKPTVIEKYRNLIPVGDNRDLSFIEQPVKGSDSWQLRTGTSAVILLKYLQKVVIPYPLSFYYGYKDLEPVQISNTKAIIGLILYFLLFILLIYAWFKDKLLASGLLIYLFSIIIFANYLFPVAGMFAERYLLVPSLGFCIVLVWLIFKVFKVSLKDKAPFSNLKSSSKYVFVALFSCYALFTFSRNSDWKDKLTLYRTDIKNVPNSAQAHNLLALELMSESMKSVDQNGAFSLRQEAKSHFFKALSIYPDFFNVRYDIGRVYSLDSNLDSAKFYFESAAKLPNEFPPLYFSLFEIYKFVKDTTGMIDCLQHLAAFDTESQTHLQNLYQLYMAHSNYREALFTVKKANTLIPNSPPILVTIGDTYLKLGNSDSASYFYDLAFSINKDSSLKSRLSEKMKLSPKPK